MMGARYSYLGDLELERLKNGDETRFHDNEAKQCHRYVDDEDGK